MLALIQLVVATVVARFSNCGRILYHILAGQVLQEYGVVYAGRRPQLFRLWSDSGFSGSGGKPNPPRMMLFYAGRLILKIAGRKFLKF